MKDLVVIQDSREQKPWIFDNEAKVKSGYSSKIVGTEVGCLDAADYSLKGYEDIIRIEKKRGFTELFGNMTPIANKERFHREMEKLKDVKHKYLIIEGIINSDILSMSIQQFKYPIPSSVVLKWILDLQIEYNIVPIFAGDAGAKISRYLFDKMVQKYG